MNFAAQAIIVHKHPVVLTGPFIAALAGLIFVAVLSEATPAHASILIILLWTTWGVLLFRLIWRTAVWATESLLVTPQQVSLSSGIISRTTNSMAVARITNVSIRESFLGRVLGYGELILELPDRNPGLFIIDHIPYSDRLYLELYAWIFLDVA